MKRRFIYLWCTMGMDMGMGMGMDPLRKSLGECDRRIVWAGEC